MTLIAVALGASHVFANQGDTAIKLEIAGRPPTYLFCPGAKGPVPPKAVGGADILRGCFFSGGHFGITSNPKRLSVSYVFAMRATQQALSPVGKAFRRNYTPPPPYGDARFFYFTGSTPGGYTTSPKAYAAPTRLAERPSAPRLLSAAPPYTTPRLRWRE